MLLHDALRTRRTIQSFRPDAVPLEAVRRAIELAVLAPNHKLTEPWRFTLLGRAVREPLADLAVMVRRAKPGDPPTSEQEAKLRTNLLAAPLGLLMRRVRSPHDTVRDAEDLAALACAAQNVMLSLHADGIGSKWATPAVLRHPDARALLDLPDDGTTIEGILWIGYAAAVPEVKPRQVESVYEERLEGDEAA